jgi:hypothetical protein
MHQAVTHIPATTANLGPGYDCLGIALALGNRVTVERLDSGSRAAGMPAQAAERFFAAAAVTPFAFTWSIAGEVPQSRGMGSSVTVRLGILHGLNELSGRPLDAFAIFMLCAELEGHPDNAAPAAFGGFAVSKPGREADHHTRGRVVALRPAHSGFRGEHTRSSEGAARYARSQASRGKLRECLSYHCSLRHAGLREFARLPSPTIYTNRIASRSSRSSRQ